MNLAQLINNKNSRLIFGKRELKIIEKQLYGVKLSASEKTRLSRDIRKKFEAIRLFLPFADKFDLKHGALILEMTEEVKEAILNSKYFAGIKQIILFGSAAENQLTLSSDIDIAVEFNEINKKDAWQFRLDVLRKVDERVQIHVYNLLPDKIKSEIKLKGKVLYEHKDSCFA